MGTKRINSRLRVLMAEHKKSQKDLIEDLALGPATVSRLFHDTFSRIDRKTIEKLLNYFDCPPFGPDGLFVVVEDGDRHE